MILSANRWIRLVSNQIAAKVYDRTDIYSPLIYSAFFGFIATLIYAQTSGVLLFLIARIIWGFCWSHLRLGSYLVIIKTSRKKLGLAMGSMNAVSRLGSAFTVLFGGFLIDQLGYRPGMTIMAILSIPAIFVMFWLRSKSLNPNNDSDNNDELDVQQVTSKSSIDEKVKRDNKPGFSPIFCNLNIFINSLIAGLIVSSLSIILKQRIHVTMNILGITIGLATVSGILLAARWSSNTVIAPISGAISNLWGRKKVYIILVIVEITSLTIFSMVSNILVTIIFICVIFFSNNSLITILNAAIANTVNKNNSNKRLSLYASYQDLGAACGPLFGYIIGASYNFSIAFLICTCMLLFLLILMFLDKFPRSEGKEGSKKNRTYKEN